MVSQGLFVNARNYSLEKGLSSLTLPFFMTEREGGKGEERGEERGREK
jgi:hypothetical protein